MPQTTQASLADILIDTIWDVRKVGIEGRSRGFVSWRNCCRLTVAASLPLATRPDWKGVLK